MIEKKILWPNNIAQEVTQQFLKNFLRYHLTHVVLTNLLTLLNVQEAHLINYFCKHLVFIT